MTAITWGSDERLYEYGIDRGVAYISGNGFPWFGLISVEETPGDVSTSSYYYDGVKTIDMVSGEDFAVRIVAYTYPEEMEDLTDQFNLTYRSLHSAGYKIHLVYNAQANPVGRFWTTITENVDLLNPEWNINTVPTEVPFMKPTAHLVIDTLLANEEALSELENLLYGTEDNNPTFPTAEEVINIFSDHAIFVVVDHGDGTWTATGPDDMIEMIDLTTFQITSPSAIYIDSESYNLSSY